MARDGESERSGEQHPGDPRHAAQRESHANQAEGQRARGRRSPARRERGQNPPRDEPRREHADHRQNAELRQALEAGEQQREGAEDGGEHRKAQGRPDSRQDVGDRFAGLALREDVGRIIDCLADHGRAEGERDPVNRAEQRAHCSESHEQARQHRQRGERHGGGRTVYEDQYQENQRAREPREPAGFVLDCRTRARGKHARSADQHAILGTRSGQSKGVRQGVGRLLLAHGIHSGGRGLRNEERASAVSRKPDAVPRGGRALTHGLGEAAQFVRRVARDHRLERRSLERREPCEVLAQRAGERLLAEALGAHRRAEQIAMLQSELARASSEFSAAVHDIVEAPVGRDRAREFAGEARELRWRAAFDRDQHGAGGHA